MTALKLLALDEDDLKVMSAHVQDAVMKVGDLQFLPAAKRFVLPMNRFAWEVKTASAATSRTTCCRCWPSVSCRSTLLPAWSN